MEATLIKIIIDFGLVILIWMTQLVVYPSFTFFSPNDLVSWHQKYTIQISIIVMPLMLAQVVLHTVHMYQNFTFLQLISLVIIVLMWLNTFLYAVPLHHKIAANTEVKVAAKALVTINWFRTIGWTLVFLLSFFDFLKT